MNRVSFGVQSFVDSECRAVGRLHSRQVCLDEIRRLRDEGINEINVDLIVGLPGQTKMSWRESVEVAIATGVPHISMYMLEVDEDSRLGREMLAEGSRYGASNVPEEDSIAEWYGAACEWLQEAGVHQYEISNFAQEGHSSRHNTKYWKREPYIGLGLDAHSMLRNREGRPVRFGNTDELSEYLAGTAEGNVEVVDRAAEIEEAWFLCLRLVDGVSLTAMRTEFGDAAVAAFDSVVTKLVEDGLLGRVGDRVALTMRGRILSNEVFAEFIGIPALGVIAQDESSDLPLLTR